MVKHSGLTPSFFVSSLEYIYKRLLAHILEQFYNPTIFLNYTAEKLQFVLQSSHKAVP